MKWSELGVDQAPRYGNLMQEIQIAKQYLMVLVASQIEVTLAVRSQQIEHLDSKPLDIAIQGSIGKLRPQEDDHVTVKRASWPIPTSVPMKLRA
jgi:hypothetical protein